MRAPRETNQQNKALQEPDARRPGTKWGLISKTEVDEALKLWVALSMFHIHIQCTPNRDIVRIHQEKTGEAISLDKPAKKGQLVLVPYGKKILSKKSGNIHNFVPISYSPKNFESNTSVGVSSEECGDMIFWKLIGNIVHQPEGPTTLSWATAKMDVPLKVGRSGGQKETTGLAKAGNFKTLTITFPYLTNKDDLPARAHLTIPRDKIPDV